MDTQNTQESNPNQQHNDSINTQSNSKSSIKSNIAMRILYGIYGFFSGWSGTILLVLFVIFFVAQGFVIPSRSMVGTLYEGDILFAKKYVYGIPIPRLPWVNTTILPDFFGNGHLIKAEGPKRGDIVIFIPPHLEKLGIKTDHYIKRTFAKGGDEVLFTPRGMYLHPSEGNEYVKEHYNGYEMVQRGDKLFVLEPFSKEHLGISYDEGISSFYQMASIYNEARQEGRSPYNFSAQYRGIAMEAVIDNGRVEYFYKKIEQDEYFMVGDNRNNSEDSRFWGSVPYANIIGTPWFIYLSINLTQSLESNAYFEPKQRYALRWERMFKTMDSIEHLARQKASKKSNIIPSEVATK